MALVVYPERNVTLTLVAADANGEAIKFTTVPQWQGDEIKLRILAADDGMSAEIAPLLYGWTTVTVTANVKSKLYMARINLVVQDDLVPSKPWRGIGMHAIFGVRSQEVYFTR